MSRRTLLERLREPAPPRLAVLFALFLAVWSGVRHATYHAFWMSGIPGPPPVPGPDALPPEQAYREVVERLAQHLAADPQACQSAMALTASRSRDRVLGASLLLMRATVASRCDDDVEADRAFREAFRRRDVLSSLPAQSLGFVTPPEGYPPRVRDSARDTLSYLFATYLTGMPALAVPSDRDPTVDLRDLLRRPRSASVALDPEALPIERASAVLDDLESWHRARGDREAALEARLERARLFGARWEEARAPLLEDLEARLPGFRDVAWYSMGMVEAAFLALPDATAPHDARTFVAEAMRAFPDSFGATQATQMSPVLELRELDPEVWVRTRIAADGRLILVVTHRKPGTLLLTAWRPAFEDLIRGSATPSLPVPFTAGQPGLTVTPGAPAQTGEIVRAAATEWSVSLRGGGSRTTESAMPLPPGRFRIEARLADRDAPASWFVTPARFRVLLSSDAGSIVARVVGLDGEPVPDAEVYLVSVPSLEPHSARIARTDAEGVATLPRAEAARNGTYVVARKGGDIEVVRALLVPEAPQTGLAWSRPTAAASPSTTKREPASSLELEPIQTPEERERGTRRVVGRILPAPGRVFAVTSIVWRCLGWRDQPGPRPPGFVSYPAPLRRVLASGRGRLRGDGRFEIDLERTVSGDALLLVEARDEKAGLVTGSLQPWWPGADLDSGWAFIDAPRVVHGADHARVRVWRLPGAGAPRAAFELSLRRDCEDRAGEEVFRARLAHDGEGLATLKLPVLDAGCYTIVVKEANGSSAGAGRRARRLLVVNEETPGPEPQLPGSRQELSLWATSRKETGLAYLGWSGQGPVFVDVLEPGEALRSLVLRGSGGQRLEVTPGSQVWVRLVRDGVIESAEVVVPGGDPRPRREGDGELDVALASEIDTGARGLLDVLVRSNGRAVAGAHVHIAVHRIDSCAWRDLEDGPDGVEWVSGTAASSREGFPASGTPSPTRVYPSSWVRWPQARSPGLPAEGIQVLGRNWGGLGSCVIRPEAPERPALRLARRPVDGWNGLGFLRLAPILPAVATSPDRGLTRDALTGVDGHVRLRCTSEVGWATHVSVVAEDREGRVGRLERLLRSPADSARQE